jgi:hypothetical protein
MYLKNNEIAYSSIATQAGEKHAQKRKHASSQQV